MISTKIEELSNIKGKVLFHVSTNAGHSFMTNEYMIYIRTTFPKVYYKFRKTQFEGADTLCETIDDNVILLNVNDSLEPLYYDDRSYKQEVSNSIEKALLEKCDTIVFENPFNLKNKLNKKEIIEFINDVSNENNIEILFV